MIQHDTQFNAITGRSIAQPRRLKLAVLATFLLAFVLAYFPASRGVEASAAQNQVDTQKEAKRRERFDYLVRADFFAGAAGDKESLDRVMKLCEETLARNPKHAEAMVWHGAGLLVLAGQAFQAKDFQKGMEHWNRGLKEMDAAAALEPENPGVLIPRGAVLLAVSRFAQPPEQRPALLEKGLGDYEKVLKMQEAYFDKLSGHARGELLFGLADGWQRAGNAEKARGYFQRILKEAAGSARQKQASTFLATGTLPPNSENCTGCHTR